MLSAHGTPVHEVLQDLVNDGSALQRLRTALHEHRVYPSISYDQGTRLHVATDVTISLITVAGDRLYFWERAQWEPPRDPDPQQCAPLDDVAETARRIAAFYLALRSQTPTPSTGPLGNPNSTRL